MTLHSSMLRNSLFLIAVLAALVGFFVFAPSGFAQGKQEKQDNSRAAAQTKPDASPSQKQSGAQAGLKPMPRDEEGREAIEEGPDFLKRRQDWFFQPRAFPLGFIPQGARERALQQKMQMYQREGRFNLEAAPGTIGFVAPSSGTGSAWFSIGPQPTSTTFNTPFTSGRVTALAVNPNNANNVYLGGADGGLWVTTDGGNTWTPLTDNPPNAANIPTVAVGAIAVDPTTCTAGGICTTVYVGTGEDNFAGDNIYGEGVLNCTVTAVTPPTAACTQDLTFHSPSPLDQRRGGPLVGALAVNRANHNILLAGVRGRGSALVSGVYCSSDKGLNWTRVLPTSLTNGAGDPGTDVAFASDGTAWVALGFPFGATGNGIYKSSAPVTSCTITFNQQTNLPATIPASSIGRITLALAPSSNDTIYAAIADATSTSTNLLGVVRSTNATAGTPTWTQLTDPLVSAATGFCTGQCFYDMTLAVDPVNRDVVYAGGGGKNPIIRTMTGTGAASFTDVTAAGGVTPHVDTHAFAFASDGSKLWVGNDGGVWSTNTPAGTISWSNLNAPSSGSSTGALNLTQFYPQISIHPANPGFAMGGTQDNGIQIDQASTTPATPLIWKDSGLPCDGGFTVIDPNIPSTDYSECEYIPKVILNIGVTFLGDGLIGNGFLAVTGINSSDRGSFIPPLVVDKTNSQTLYFGTCRVWQTKDGANTWNAISPDVTTSTHPVGCAVPTAAGQPSGVLSTIAVAPSNSNTVYVGADNGEIEVTTDGATWTSIVPAAGTLPTRAVTQIVVDPSNAAIAYAAFSGFGTCNNSAVVCDGKGHVFKTMNGTAGAATVWTDISVAPFSTMGLPDIPVNAMVIDPTDTTHNTLYAGTDIGAFFTNNGGVTWSGLGAVNSIPNAQILSLALHNPSRTLRAATHGRGMWDLNLGGQSSFGITSISPFSAAAGAAAITNFTVNGNGFTVSSVVKFTANGTTTALAGSCTAITSTCTATIPMVQLQNGVLAQITVTDPAQPNPTNAVPFTVLNPVPTIVSISPTMVASGSSSLLLTVTGSSPSNFLCGTNGTLVLFNSVALPASAITACNPSAGTLTVQVPAANLTTAKTVSVDTFNAQPGGGPDTNPTPPTLTITAQATTTTVTSSATSIASGGSVTLTATVATTSHGAGPTGTVQFKNGTSTLSAAVTCTPTAGTTTATAFCTATLTTTLAFLAPPSVPDRVPNIRFQPVVLVAFLLLLLFLFSLRRIPAAYRRGYACAALLLLAALVAGLVGCGGSGGSGVHSDSITAVYSGDATYAGSTSSAITITVQ